MIDGTLLALGVLVLAGLGLGAVDALELRTARVPARSLALVALALAFAAGVQSSGRVNLWPDMLLDDPLARIACAWFLGAAALTLVGRSRLQGRVEGQPAPCALYLLGSAGGLLAISTRNMVFLWIGLELYGLSMDGAVASGRQDATGSLRRLGSSILLLGIGLLYVSAGTLDMMSLGQRLWQQGGGPSTLLYWGVGLALGGITLATGLLPPYGKAEDSAILSTMLGALLVLRLGLYGLGSLVSVWSSVLIALALAALVWGGVAAWQAGNSTARLIRLNIAQRGLLLLALAFSARAGQLAAVLVNLLAYALAQFVLERSLDELAPAKSSSPASSPVRGNRDGPELPGGLLQRQPTLGAPLLVALLSLAGAPPLLGFVGRAQLLWGSQPIGWPWLTGAILALSLIYTAPYLRAALWVARGAPTLEGEIRPPLALSLALGLAALGLVLLGLYPTLFYTLARQVTGL